MVKFIGRTKFAKGEMIGLELDTWYPGGDDGTVRGRRYFQAQKGQGCFLRRADIAYVIERRAEPLQVGDSVKLIEKGCNITGVVGYIGYLPFSTDKRKLVYGYFRINTKSSSMDIANVVERYY